MSLAKKACATLFALLTAFAASAQDAVEESLKKVLTDLAYKNAALPGKIDSRPPQRRERRFFGFQTWDLFVPRSPIQHPSLALAIGACFLKPIFPFPSEREFFLNFIQRHSIDRLFCELSHTQKSTTPA